MKPFNETENAVALWNGEWISENALPKRISELCAQIQSELPEPLHPETVLAASALLSQELSKKESQARVRLSDSLKKSGALCEAEIQQTLEELSHFLSREQLEEKLSRELPGGSDLKRIDFKRDLFENWAPLGFLVHIAPSNALNVPFLSVVEGLLAGNVNFLKTGGSNENTAFFPLQCLHELIRCSGGALCPYIYAARISSQRKDLLKQILAPADGVAVWGAEEALEGIRSLAPAHARIIEWGPKLSFAYLDNKRIHEASLLERLATECCLLDQQACSSPQVIYVETDQQSVLLDFAQRFAKAMTRISPTIPATIPSSQEQAEITKTVALAELETYLPNASAVAVICDTSHSDSPTENPRKAWRILVDMNPGLCASPLFRSVWIKPLLREQIQATLRPLRHYLQTVGLACIPENLAPLSSFFYRAGVLRVAPIGEMLGGYTGEPHDGVYALQRYSRRLSLRASCAESPAPSQTATALSGISRIQEIQTPPSGEKKSSEKTVTLKTPIMGKAEFSAQLIDRRHSELFFKSGGSSGTPKLSVFTYHDYQTQMHAAAQGLFAAGLDPSKDRCMNLFFGGGLYGGFLSFFTILENLRAVQFPMAAHSDLKAVARVIVDHQVNVLLGMPSFLAQLFATCHEELKAYGGIEKIFYGGEHIAETQRAYLREEFGVRQIRSAAYGSNDIGPIGFQCLHSEGSVHHLLDTIHQLEIIQLEKDHPASPGEMGRMIFTSRRQGQNIQRYDLGDLGRWIDFPPEQICPCGRTSPRFELLGRQGDVFRIGATFLNYLKFETILIERFGFSGELQLSLESSTQSLGKEKLKLAFSQTPTSRPLTGQEIRRVLLEEYPDLHEAVLQDDLLEFECLEVTLEQIERIAGSGKLRRVIERRKGG